VPTYKAWRRSGEVVAELIRARRLSRTGMKPSFLNDVLLAASCREHGVTLITRNRADFEMIATVEPVQFTDPWPVS
jgi:predicted nucleic acid-binding protein